jgi:hypothetical protein
MTISEAQEIFSISSNLLSGDELKKAYKKLILKWHPDIAANKGISISEATSISQKIILAYEVLSRNLRHLDASKVKHPHESKYHYRASAKKSYKRYFDFSIDDIDEPFLNRITLNSSNVKWVDYIDDLEMLIVRFKSTYGFYVYYDVPKDIYLSFRTVESPGRYVHEKLNLYRYELITDYAEWLNIYRSLENIFA